MKRIALCVVMVAVVLGGSTQPAFSLPLQSVEEGASLFCSLSSDQGTGNLSIGYSEDGYYVTTTVWRAGDTPGEDQPWLEGWLESFGTDVVLDGTALHATIPLYNFETEGEEQGVAHAVLTASAEPTKWGFRNRVANAWREERFTKTPATATGTYTVAGLAQFALSGCVGELLRTEYFGTEPAAEVRNFGFFEMSCRIDSGVEEIVVSAWSDSRRGRVRGELVVVVFPDEGCEFAAYGGGGTATISRTSIRGTVALTDDSGVRFGTATVTARLSVLDVERGRSTDGGYTSSYRRDTLGVDGTLALPDGRTFDLAGCPATRLTGLSRITPGS